MTQELRNKLVRNFNETELEFGERTPFYEGRAARVIGPRIEGCAARDLGASIDIIPPGKMSCPYHFHYAEEEMFIILEGEGTFRKGGERWPVRAGDVISAVAGDASTAHQIINTGTTELRYFAISTRNDPDILEYPDSGKFMVASGIPAGGGMMGAEFVLRGRDKPLLDYWDGEDIGEEE